MIIWIVLYSLWSNEVTPYRKSILRIVEVFEDDDMWENLLIDRE